MHRALRFAGWAAASVGGLVIAALIAGWLTLRASLPQLDGSAPIAGLSASATVERDALGVPTIRGATRLDVARATGFVHAQDRFFQMDLQRRAAAGELAALFGPLALEFDRGVRWHRFRWRAQQAVARLEAGERALLQAYADGVNAGLATLGARPFEYFALRMKPVAWRPEDTVLAAYAMFLDLQETDARRELSREAMERTLPAEVVGFLADNGSAWSARLDGTADPIRPIPGPESFAYLASAAAGSGEQEPIRLVAARTPGPGLRDVFSSQGGLDDDPETVDGSNNWALAGRLTTRGGAAIVANDMHLVLRNLPTTWYRARFVVGAEGGRPAIDVCGVMLPGAPFIVAGSNGRVAWGFTNSQIDTADPVIIEPAGSEADSYLTPDGPRPIARVTEIIDVVRGASEREVVEETIWGPVMPQRSSRPERKPRRLALAWVAHDVSLVNFHFLEFESAGSVDDAVRVAQDVWLPTQNLVVGDTAGRVAWTLIGPVPKRVGFDGKTPVSMADGSRRWAGMLAAAERPVILDPPGGRVWTSNQQVVGGEVGAALGDGGLAIDGRAFQIGQRLHERKQFDELAALDVQLDTNVYFLRRWGELVVGLLDDEAVAGKPERAEFRRLVSEWKGGAAPESAGYRLIRRFRERAAEMVFGRLLAVCRREFGSFSYTDFAYEEPLWLLASRRAPWTAGAGGWRAELLGCVDGVAAELKGGTDSVRLADRTWGEVNRVDMCHPLGRMVSVLRPWLGMPADAVAGDRFAPNANQGWHGPSERMVVSPGREAAGILHLPGGQSGHPLSRFFRASHQAWLSGAPTPFLPGERVSRLDLVPVLARGDE